MKKNDDFELTNLPEEVNDPEIKKEDFVLQQADKEIHEQKFQTKPTTFFKDSMKRFSKNKSSVVASYILGILILFAIFVPIISPYDVSKAADDIAFNYLEPKLFDNTNGFWDGTVKKDHIPVDTSSPDPDEWWPDQTYYKRDGISNYQLSEEEYTSNVSTFGRGGFVRVGYYGTYGLTEAQLESPVSSSIEFPAELDLNTTTLTLEKFDTVDEQKIKEYHAQEGIETELPSNVMPENFVLGNASLIFYYEDEDNDMQSIEIVAPKLIHNIGSTLSGATDKDPVNITDIIKSKTTQEKFKTFYFAIKVKGLDGTAPTSSVCTLVKSFSIKTSGTPSEAVKGYFEGGNFDKKVGTTTYKFTIPGISFTDAMEFMARTSKLSASDLKIANTGYWSVQDLRKYSKNIHLGRCTYASFTYDTYRGVFGRREGINITGSKLDEYAANGWLEWDYVAVPKGDGTWTVLSSECEILSDKCPILEPFTKDDISIYQPAGLDEPSINVKCTVTYYRYLGYDKMPAFTFGTDKIGVDMFKYVFEGLRNSLILGVITFAVCFVFGLIYGAVSGYFGGAVDLVMERITDILSGIPWIVLMTIAILKLGQNFGTFVLALCLTGWIGTASTTRTQFYRFRGREYVLASRTLGASDARLIAKHILPNAMGTIITGAVLMIPSVIFSEATISYLGLGFKGLSSLGVILSDNQAELFSHPYLLLFPATVIALIMISFNLFGNGLRDAINPSLKGEE